MPDPQEQKRLYDAACKSVLSEKSILANILRDCVEEFHGYEIVDIANRYIQGKPEVGNIIVEPDGVLRVTGQQTEDKSETEGSVFYDIRFNALAPAGGHPIRLIINVEAQNDFHPGYPLLKRAIYYCSRLISSQYGSVFVKSHYEKIQKVYSIWICTAPTKNWAYTITRYRLQEENIVGQAKAAREDYDLLTPILVCLGSERYTELTGLLRMLNLVLIDSVDSTERLRTLENEFDVKVTPHLERGVAKMCNLSEGVERRGINRGIAIGEARGITIGEARGITIGKENNMLAVACNMLNRQKYSLDEIADISGLPLNKVQELAGTTTSAT